MNTLVWSGSVGASARYHNVIRQFFSVFGWRCLASQFLSSSQAV
ncbi:hypothetical protein [Enterovibrio norvegicus]